MIIRTAHLRDVRTCGADPSLRYTRMFPER